MNGITKLAGSAIDEGDGWTTADAVELPLKLGVLEVKDARQNPSTQQRRTWDTYCFVHRRLQVTLQVE